MTTATAITGAMDQSGSRLMLRAAHLRTWLARAEPGQRIAYHRGHLIWDRSPDSGLSKQERRELVAVANLALALAGHGRLHLLQRRFGEHDYGYYAQARDRRRA